MARYRAFRDRVHQGPLYTVLGDRHQAGNQADPFESMPTYTQKYRKQTRKIPRLDTRPYGEPSHGRDFPRRRKTPSGADAESFRRPQC